MKNVIILGITGQDGVYLTDLLLSKGYTVYGTFHSTSSVNLWRIKELGISNHPNLHVIEYDLTSPGASVRLLQSTSAEEVYKLAAQSFVCVSFAQQITAAETTGIGAVNLLETIRVVDTAIRFCQASASEIFGRVQAIRQCKSAPCYLRNTYGLAKRYAH